MRKMKKILCVIFVVLAVETGYAQTMRASIGSGGAANRIRIYIRPDATLSAVISTLQFNVGLPNTIPNILTQTPTLTLISNNIAGVTWIIDPAVNEGGFLNYNIYNAQAGYNLNCVANTEILAMELAFIGGPPGLFPNAANLITLGDGGTLNTHLFYCTGTINSNGQDLYYARDANVVVANGDSYFPTIFEPTGPTGTFTSFARLVSSILLTGVLPVTFSNYNVKCNDKGALLTWETAFEQNSDKFEIQRSTNNVDWAIIDYVIAAGNSDIQRNYQYLDLKGGAAFYRIRQVDKDGRFSYTAIKQTNCKVSQFDVSLYPVPANDKLTVVIKSDQAVRTELQIVDISGRIVSRTVTQINNGNNNFVLNVSELPGGQYLLTSSDPSIIINKKFTVLR
jgi:hypothetical protein